MSGFPDYERYDALGLAAKLEPTDQDYIAACPKAERSARRRAQRVKVLVGALAACAIVVAVLGYSGFLDPSNLKIQVRKYTDIYMPRALTAEQVRALKPGDRFQECASCPEMVVAPAGEFMMGSDDGHKDEKPAQRVVIGTLRSVGLV